MYARASKLQLLATIVLFVDILETAKSAFIDYLPLQVVNSTSLALLDCTNDSETIMGVYVRSQP